MSKHQHKPPSWLVPSARKHWDDLARQLWGSRRPTPLERVGAALLAEELQMYAESDGELQQSAFVRANSLLVALRMEPMARRRADAERGER